MKPMTLNMSKMSKIAGDKKTSTFRHDDGHTMIIVHAALPALQRKQIEKMPLCEGGDVKKMAKGGEVEKPDKKPPKKEPIVRPDKGYGKVILKEAEGGEIKTTEDSSDYHKKTKEVKEDATREVPLADQLSQGWKNIKAAVSGQPYAEGGDVKMYADPQEPVSANDAAPVVQQPPPPAQAPAQQPPAAGQAPVFSPSTPMQADPAVTMAQSQQPVEVPTVPAARPNLNPDGTMNPSAIAENAQAAVEANKQIEMAQGRAAANRQAGYIQAAAQQQQDLRNNYNDLLKHTNEASTWFMNNPPNPDQYRESMSAGRKVGTAIALVLGGLGQGAVGGNNPAMDFLNAQIDRDIEAQKRRSDQVRTIYGAYKELYGDGLAANNATKATMLDLLKQQTDQTAAQLGTPIAQQRALELGTRVALEKSKLLQDATVDLHSLQGFKPGTPVGKDGRNPLPGKTPASSAKDAPTSNDKGASALIPPDKYADSSILLPDAEKRLDALRYRPKAKEEIDQIKEAYKNASAADQVLSQLHEVHQTIYKDAREGGTGGYMRRHDPIESLPWIGKTAHGLVAQPITDTESNRDYETNKTRIISDIANALKGTNVSGDEINRIVDANTPEHGDSPQQVARKERAIRIFIKNATLKDQALLKYWGLSKK